MQYEQIRYEQIIVEKRDAITLLTLNRPDRLNAWTVRMCEELMHAIEAANEDYETGAIVLTGAGRGFCAGADIGDNFKARIDSGKDAGAEASDSGSDSGMDVVKDWVSLVRRSKPLLAAVNGPAVGIGVSMILPFDVIVAAEEAKFGLVFVKMGLVPELAASHFLVSRMGWGHAHEMMLTGRLYAGAEAQAKGLCEYVVPQSELLDKTLSIARLMAANPSRMLRMTKELITQNACTDDVVHAQQLENAMLNRCWSLPEHHEAVDAFLNKRVPDFAKVQAGLAGGGLK